jgi:hypothetical protein
MTTTSTPPTTPSVSSVGKPPSFKLPPEASILLVLIGISLFFEALGWYINGQSFIFNLERLQIIILQMSVIGIIAVGVNMVIITGGIDLSSGSVVAATAVVSASLAQVSDFPRAVFPHLTDLPMVWPILAGVTVGLLIGLLNGTLIALTAIPPFIATLGTMVAARGFAKWFTGGMPVSMLTDDFAAIGAGANPVYIFLLVAAIFHVVLRYTRFGIKIVAYDRLIVGSKNVDYYTTFDNFQVGVLQAQSLEKALGLKEGKGPFNIELFGGSADDNNAFFFYDGAMSVLQPYIDKGKLVVQSKQVGMNKVSTLRWDGAVAQARMDNLLSAYYGNNA